MALPFGSDTRKYLLVDSESVYVEHHQRQSMDEWLLHEYWALESTLQLKSVGVEVSVDVLYD